MKIISYLTFMIMPIIPLTSCHGQSSSSTKETSNKPAIEYLTNATFKQKVFDYEKNKEWKFIGDKPCIIDFFATWCGPCKMLSPTIEQVATDYKGKINVYKIDVDQQKELAGAFGISSIPTLLFCPGTGQPQIAQGLMSKEELSKAIKEVLKIQ
jgi:thioredoxin